MQPFEFIPLKHSDIKKKGISKKIKKIFAVNK